MRALSSEPARRCVYTSLVGRYEELCEQSVAASSNLPFICLTDDPDLRSSTWEIRVVEPLFRSDPVRSQRDFKLRPHMHLPDFDASMYIDNSVELGARPEDVFAKYPTDRGIAVSPHSFRETVLDEFNAVVHHQLDDHTRVYEQLNHYALNAGHVLDQRPYWCGLLLRDHNDEPVQRLGEIWAAHVWRYSRRDQLSFNYALFQAGVTPAILDVDNHQSWFHTWGHFAIRRQLHEANRNAARSLQPLVARLRSLEVDVREKSDRIAELSAAIEQMQHSVANAPPPGATASPP